MSKRRAQLEGGQVWQQAFQPGLLLRYAISDVDGDKVHYVMYLYHPNLSYDELCQHIIDGYCGVTTVEGFLQTIKDLKMGMVA